MVQGEITDAGIRQEGELFSETGEKNFTIVGKLDLTTPTTTPGYYAMGYLDREELDPADELVVYVQVNRIKETYLMKQSKLHTKSFSLKFLFP